ncbi:MAG: hypothetical protein WCF84_18695 [Anaerolineae bacterium]
MHPRDLQQQIETWTAANCGLEERTYLSISDLHKTPCEIYENLTRGRDAAAIRPEYKQLFYYDRALKADMIRRLEALGLYSKGAHEITAYGGRVRGHPDGLAAGNLLHIKPCNGGAFDKVRETRRMPERDFEQMQLYLLYAKREQMNVIYLDRSTGAFYVIGVRFDERTAQRMDQRVQDILQAVDRHQPPECRCGRHKVEYVIRQPEYRVRTA